MSKRKLVTVLSYEERIARMLETVVNNLDRSYLLEELASYAYLSAFHLHRVFYSMFGETLTSVIRKLRMYNAIFQLQNQPEKTITEIAFACGFSSSQNFARCLKKYFACSPSDFRVSLPFNFNSYEFISDNPYSFEYSLHNCLIKAHIIPNLTVLSKVVSMNVEIADRPSYRVAYVRHNGSYNLASLAWKKIFAWASSKDILFFDTITIGISYDDPNFIEANKCRYDACVVLPEGVKVDKVDGDIQEQTVASGLYANYHRPTRISDFAKAYNELMGIWLAQTDYECIGTPYEYYPNMYEQKAAPDYEWDLTFCLPVHKSRQS